jgi:tetratricopeptide (TPR) repeat protein
MRFFAPFAGLLLCGLTATTPALASDSTWTGKQVILSKPESELKIGDRVVGHGDVFRVYRVDREDGSWLWLVHPDVSGWATTEEVIPFETAIEVVTQKIKDQPTEWAYRCRGACWCVREDYDRAIADFDAAIKLDPSSASAFANRGIAYERKKNYKMAVADYTEAIRLDPKYPNYYFDRGNANRLAKNYQDALDDYEAAIKADPNFAAGYVNRAWLRATCPETQFRNGKEAVESATKACELSGWRASSHLDVLAAAYAENGNFDEAIKWQNSAIHNLPEGEKAIRARFDAHLKSYQEKRAWRDDGSGK